MFKYDKLVKTLKEKGISLDELCERAGIGIGLFRAKLNGNEYISMNELGKICGCLECQPGDIMTWEEGNMPSSERMRIDWEKVVKLSKEKHVSLSVLSSYCRMDRTSLKKAIQRDSSVKYYTLMSICKRLECSPGDIIKHADKV